MIQIKSRIAAIEFATENPDHPLIAIGETRGSSVLDLYNKASNSLLLRFDDIHEAREGFSLVTFEQIQKAVDWAHDKKDLVIACHKGVSRSSALAYVIACSKEGHFHHPLEGHLDRPLQTKDLHKGLEVLDPEIHKPNPYIVLVGSVVLKSHAMYEVYCHWMGKNKI